MNTESRAAIPPKPFTLPAPFHGQVNELLTPAELRAQLKISPRTYARRLLLGLPHRLVMTDRRFVFHEVLSWLPRNPEPRRLSMPRPLSRMGGSDLVAQLKREAKLFGRR